MKYSRLHQQHTQLGATFEEITGWEMPVHYGDVAAEHRAVRQAVGIADLSHRGKLRVTGEDRVKWLQSVISNDILPLQPGQGRYSSLLTHKGKILTYFRLYMQSDTVTVEEVGEIGESTFQAFRKFLLYGTKATTIRAAGHAAPSLPWSYFTRVTRWSLSTVSQKMKVRN